MDLTKFTTEELKNMRDECLLKVCAMTANPQVIELLANIEKELQSR